MKKVLLFASLFTITFSFGQSNSLSQNNITAVPFPTPLGSSLGLDEIFRFQAGAVTQLSGGTSDFTFGNTDEWFSLGKVPAGGQTFYGSRFQFKGSALVTGYTSASPAKPRIQWIHNGGTTAKPLEFIVGNGFGSLPSGGNPGTQGTTKLVAIMTPNGANTYFGENVDEVFPFGDNNVTSPKVGIFTKGQLGLSINNFNGSLIAPEIFGAKIRVRHVSDFGYGIFSECSDGGMSTGVYGKAIGRDVSTGVHGISINSNASASYGVKGETDATASFNAGIYGIAASTTGNNFAGYFNGNIMTTAGTFLISDAKLKNEISNEINVLEKISLLRPVTYNFNKTDGLVLPEINQHGFISQEMAEVFPELTKDVTQPVFDEDGKIVSDISYKAINYTGLISVLTAGIQELNTELVEEIKSVREELSSVKDELAEYKANDKIRESLVQASREVSDYSMEQNTPNPFNDRTVIRYQLASEVNQASITIFNLNGGFVKDYPLEENKGEITILASEVGKGMFIYSLTRNGQEIMSKRMIVR
ncbi:T9SS type A sorting domain-containing protein [Brumimicrobium glaciale]|uniref:T9SS type A sorting domain-containing protein n=1 Tax=Brumimicrobium glaciale TaxID=200475 RepID=A0A4V1WFD5_9FLAO|nr:tail fiber domain-containing protein [Brumimicrobium glaciale]RYM32816.1 T9SS type A sorting domain-containing protein [Brumimicrobium glaciale]